MKHLQKICLYFFFLFPSLYAQDGDDLIQIVPRLSDPIQSGPLTPISFYSTRFEPDSAFLLPNSIINFDFTTKLVNAGEISKNNDRYLRGKYGDLKKFYDYGPKRIYSVYIDLEYIEHNVKIAYGLFDYGEIEMTLTDYSFKSADNLDSIIKITHQLFNNSNKTQNVLDHKGPPVLIVYDNQEKKIIYELQPGSTFFPPVITLSLKSQLYQSKNQAVSINVKKNFGMPRLELKQATSSKTGLQNYDSTNFSINYTALFDIITLHIAYAETHGKNQFLPKSPQKTRYEFYGINIDPFSKIKIGLQFLKYSSPFPKDQSSIGEPIEEYTLGITYDINPKSNITFGLLENNKQGPRNVDVGLLTQLNLAF